MPPPVPMPTPKQRMPSNFVDFAGVVMESMTVEAKDQWLRQPEAHPCCIVDCLGFYDPNAKASGLTKHCGKHFEIQKRILEDFTFLLLVVVVVVWRWVVGGEWWLWLEVVGWW